MKLAKIILTGDLLRHFLPFLKGYDVISIGWELEQTGLTLIITGEGLAEVKEGLMIPDAHVETGYEEHECDACGIMHRTNWSKLHTFPRRQFSP